MTIFEQHWGNATSKKHIISCDSCWYWFWKNIYLTEEDLILCWRHLWIIHLWDRKISVSFRYLLCLNFKDNKYFKLIGNVSSPFLYIWQFNCYNIVFRGVLRKKIPLDNYLCSKKKSNRTYIRTRCMVTIVDAKVGKFCVCINLIFVN